MWTSRARRSAQAQYLFQAVGSRETPIQGTLGESHPAGFINVQPSSDGLQPTSDGLDLDVQAYFVIELQALELKAVLCPGFSTPGFHNDSTMYNPGQVFDERSEVSVL